MRTFVYVISGEHGRQKIGSSDNPQQRINNLQTGSPYPLRFEFVGEVEGGAAGQVEVEAHFNLNAYKSPGGDEWFTVPPDVAMTAVMAAAHRLGYRIKPVDPKAIATTNFPGAPWEKWVSIGVKLPFLYPVIMAVLAYNSGDLTIGSFVMVTLIMLGGMALINYIALPIARWLVANWAVAT
jgi:hypothetical protein